MLRIRIKQVLFCLVMVVYSSTLYSQSKDRIVIFGQQALEMVKYFGGKEKVVGVGYLDEKVKPNMYEDWPILTALWPSVESIVSKYPTQLFGMESVFKDKRSGSPAFWRSRGVEVTPVFDFNQSRTLAVFLEDLRTFGTVFHKQQAVETFIEQEYQKLHLLKETIPLVEGEKPKRVLFLANVRASGIYYCYTPDKCLIGSLLEDFNVEFLTSDTMVIPISLEYIVHLNPDYIILSSFQATNLEELLQFFKEHRVLRHLNAVKNNRITVVDYSNAVSGGLEFVGLYQHLLSFFYPQMNHEKK